MVSKEVESTLEVYGEAAKEDGIEILDMGLLHAYEFGHNDVSSLSVDPDDRVCGCNDVCGCNSVCDC
jgi:hypothetical protein